jgi:hypothetical protein
MACTTYKYGEKFFHPNDTIINNKNIRDPTYSFNNQENKTIIQNKNTVQRNDPKNSVKKENLTETNCMEKCKLCTIS